MIVIDRCQAYGASITRSRSAGLTYFRYEGNLRLMTISDFATENKPKVRRDPDIIPGSHDQSHVYEWSDGELAVIFITPATMCAPILLAEAS